MSIKEEMLETIKSMSKSDIIKVFYNKENIDSRINFLQTLFVGVMVVGLFYIFQITHDRAKTLEEYCYKLNDYNNKIIELENENKRLKEIMKDLKAK